MRKKKIFSQNSNYISIQNFMHKKSPIKNDILELLISIYYYEQTAFLTNKKQYFFIDTKDFYFINPIWIINFKKSYNYKKLSQILKSISDNINYYNFEINISSIKDDLSRNNFSLENEEIPDNLLVNISAKQKNSNNLFYYRYCYIIDIKIKNKIENYVSQGNELNICRQKVFAKDNFIYLNFSNNIISGNLDENFIFDSDYVLYFESPEILNEEKRHLLKSSFSDYLEYKNIKNFNSNIMSLKDENNNMIGEIMLVPKNESTNENKAAISASQKKIFKKNTSKGNLKKTRIISNSNLNSNNSKSKIKNNINIPKYPKMNIPKVTGRKKTPLNSANTRKNNINQSPLKEPKDGIASYDFDQKQEINELDLGHENLNLFNKDNNGEEEGDKFNKGIQGYDILKKNYINKVNAPNNLFKSIDKSVNNDIKIKQEYLKFKKELEEKEQEIQNLIQGKNDLIKLIKEKENKYINLIDNLKEDLENKDKEIDSLHKKINNLEKLNNRNEEEEINENQNEIVYKREKELKIKEDELNDKEKNLNEKEKEINNKIKRLNKSNYNLFEKENNMNERGNINSIIEKEIKNKENQLKIREDELNEKQNNLDEREEEFNIKQNKLNGIISKQKEELKIKENNLNKRENTILKKEVDLCENQKNLNKRVELISIKENEIIIKQNELKKRENELIQNQNMLKVKENELMKRENEINNKLKEIKDKSKNEKDNTTPISPFEKAPIKSYEKPTLIGLNNIGATCFMNSTLQCLSQTSDLTNYFLKDSKKKRIINNNLAQENKNSLQLSPIYLKLIKKLWDKKGDKSFSPNEFMSTIEKMNPLFKKGQAGDSKDFIIYILEQMHKELKAKIKQNYSVDQPLNQYDRNNALAHFMEDFSRDCSIISDAFFGFTETTNECLNCKKKYNSCYLNNPICYNFGIFNCLIFPLEEVKNYKNKNLMQSFFYMNNNMNYMNNMNNMNFMNNISQNNSVTLDDCFSYNQKTDLFTGENKNYCNICKQSYDSYYTSKIYSCPNNLILILNRGKNNMYNIKLYFNETIDITQYVVINDGNKWIYNLYGVITHIGESGPNAHFVASCKSPIDNKWYKYNDAIVNPINNVQNEIINFGTPYILFYKKQN